MKLSWITSNLGLKVASALTATVLWGAVVYAENPTMSQTLSLVPTVTGLPHGLVVVGAITPVNVTFGGLRDSIRPFSDRSQDPSRLLRVTMDLSSARPGDLAVSVQVRSLVDGVSVRNVSPSREQVRVDEAATRSIAVELVLTGALGSDYQAEPAQAQITPSSVTVTGPRSLLDQAHIAVAVDLTSATTAIDHPYAVGLRDQGNKVNAMPAGVSADPSEVEVQLPVHPRFISKQVAIQSHVSGRLPDGYGFCGIDVVPLTTVISGPPEALAQIDSLDLPGIDVDGRTSSFVASQSPILPPEVQVGPESAQVRVSVCIERLAQVVPSPTPGTPSPSSSP
ncbi:MAG: CdaR family protein [Candidatus Dormibacteria bacterium]